MELNILREVIPNKKEARKRSTRYTPKSVSGFLNTNLGLIPVLMALKKAVKMNNS
jgi:hypothetical protein